MIQTETPNDLCERFTQIPGFEYNFAPVVEISTRTLLSVAAQDGPLIHQLDVKTAFLNGKLSEERYVEKRPCQNPSEFEDYVFKLDNAPYGHKQASNV